MLTAGAASSLYRLFLPPCRSVNIRPVDAQRVALAAGQNGTISPFRIYVEDDQAASRSCWIKMLDATVRRGVYRGGELCRNVMWGVWRKTAGWGISCWLKMMEATVSREISEGGQVARGERSAPVRG